jgi:flagellin
MSSSILTDASALTALEALNMTQNNLQIAENEVSTGLAVPNAEANPAYWSIAAQMTSQNDALGAVSDALNESSSLLTTQTAALNSTITVMDAIQTDLTTAANVVSGSSSTSTLASIQTDIAAQQQALLSIGASANFNGQNFLDVATTGTVGLVASYQPGTGVSTINIDTSNTQLFETASTAATQGILGSAGTNFTGASILTLSVTAATAGDIQNMLKDVGSALSSITTAASTLGAAATNVNTQQSFISTLSDSLTTGIGSLVDADMNEVSTRLAALQVQQQLGIEALAIANSNSQLILKLFE